MGTSQRGVSLHTVRELSKGRPGSDALSSGTFSGVTVKPYEGGGGVRETSLSGWVSVTKPALAGAVAVKSRGREQGGGH